MNDTSVQGRVGILLTTFTVLVVIALFSRGYVQRPASPTSLPQPPAGREVDATQGAAGYTAEVEGVAIEASHWRMENGAVLVDICFERISEDDWNLSRSELSIGGSTIQASYWALIEYRYDESGQATQRCDAVSFPYANVAVLGEVRVTVPRLETSRSENIDCPAARSKLQGTGIEIECYQMENSGGYTVVAQPEDMPLEEAQRLADDAFIDVLVGPWVLYGELN